MESINVSHEVLLHRIEHRDAGIIFSAIDNNREWLSEWLPFVQYTTQVKHTSEFIRSILEKRDQTGNEVFTIWYKGDFAGIIGFHNTDKVNEKTEIGYWLIKEMQNKGIATSSVKNLIGFAFEKMRMNRICIKCAIGNTASEKIPLKLGFQFEGIEREGERYDDKFFDLKIYSLLKQDPRFTL